MWGIADIMKEVTDPPWRPSTCSRTNQTA